MSPIGSVFSASIATHHAASSTSGDGLGKPLPPAAKPSGPPVMSSKPLSQQLLRWQLDDLVLEQLQSGEGLVEDVI